jgi:hypothetical protein
MADTKGVLRIVNRQFPNVTKVEDAKYPLEIEVLKADVTKSKRKDMNQCAMAQACKRVYHADGVIMARSTAYLVKGDLAVRFKVPNTVSREITSFDRGGEFSTGIYMLSVPCHADTLARKEERGDNKSKGGSKKPKGIRKYHLTQGIRAVLGSSEDRG